MKIEKISFHICGVKMMMISFEIYIDDEKKFFAINSSKIDKIKKQERQVR